MQLTAVLAEPENISRTTSPSFDAECINVESTIRCFYKSKKGGENLYLKNKY